jgi:hypothetical protein
MSRPSLGTVSWRRDVESGSPCWHGRWTRADGTRTNWMALDPGIAESDEAGAQRFAARLAGTAKTTTASGKGETVADYASRWLAQRPAKTARDNASHLFFPSSAINRF